MILEYKCNSCNQYFKIKNSAKDRGEFNFYGNEMIEECSFCSHEENLDINEIVAKEGKWVKYIYIVALLISLIALYITFNSVTSEGIKIHLRRYSFVFGLNFIVPFSIAANLVNSEKKAIKRFNRYYV
jgi:uncharacterized protein YlaI